MRSINRYLAVASLIALGGLAACTKPAETTGIGAATGGVLGAGLGAVIGSQTGDAGEGLVIGAVAGSAAGGMIGNALQAQDEAIRTQDEAIERQERIISAQRSQIDELKRLNQDLSGSDGTHPNGIRLNPPIDGPGDTSTGVRLNPALKSPDTMAGTEISLDLPKPAFSNPVPVALASSKPPAPMAMAKAGAGASGIKENDIVARPGTSFAHSLDSALKEPETVNGSPSRNALNNIQVDVGDAGEERGSFAWRGDESAAAPSNPEDCSKAESEIKRIDNQTQLADKLFHYRRALRLCPERAAYHNGLGEVYVSLNRGKDADFEFREALRIDPEFKAAKKNLAGMSNRW